MPHFIAFLVITWTNYFLFVHLYVERFGRRLYMDYRYIRYHRAVLHSLFLFTIYGRYVFRFMRLCILCTIVNSFVFISRLYQRIYIGSFFSLLLVKFAILQNIKIFLSNSEIRIHVIKRSFGLFWIDGYLSSLFGLIYLSWEEYVIALVLHINQFWQYYISL